MLRPPPRPADLPAQIDLSAADRRRVVANSQPLTYEDLPPRRTIHRTVVEEPVRPSAGQWLNDGGRSEVAAYSSGEVLPTRGEVLPARPESVPAQFEPLPAQGGPLPAQRELRREPLSQRSELSPTPRSFASVALASGTGEDVAALTQVNRRTRFTLEGNALKAVAALLGAALIVTWMWFAGNSRNEAVPLTESETSAQPSAKASPKPTGEASALTVYISGAVVVPGVYEAGPDSRVNDFVEKAGGLTATADTSLINLAAVVADGDHLHIPTVGEAAAAVPGSSGDPNLVNINTADEIALQELPGIGPSLSAAIIEWRESEGSFTSVDDLLAVPGIGEATLSKFRDRATV